MKSKTTDVIVIGAGPAGVVAALRAAELGARTELVTNAEFGGMATNHGPVPVRALAYAAQLIREARRLPQYGIDVSEPVLKYDRLLGRVREVVDGVRAHSALRDRIDGFGVTVHEQFSARFVDTHTIETENGVSLTAEKFIICTGGKSRRLPVPGFELTSTHADALNLTAVPLSMLVIGAGNTGVQVASIFNTFGTAVQLFEAGPRILPSEDADVAAAVSGALRAADMVVHEQFGDITSFEKTAAGVRMNFTKNGRSESAEAALAVVALGWVADTAHLNLTAAGAEVNSNGTIKLDEYLQSSAPNIFAAGDVTGHQMLVPRAVEEGYIAATNAVLGPTHLLRQRVNPSGSLTDPEYAQVGVTEAKARESHDVVTVVVRFDETIRGIIEGRTFGFCKLVVDRKTYRILGCHVVGERAADIAQMAAIPVTVGMPVDELARIPVSFPTYAEILLRGAVLAAVQLSLPLEVEAHQIGPTFDLIQK